ncbi:STM3941 family protein [Flavobacterium sp. C4GT6]|uniref:STM3941 family protein n=1 Tax=Flavobacterium sp. C4GT6 TaxID=3103818 RepID=UPI002ED2D4F8
MEPKIITFNKVRIIILLLMALLFVIASIFIISYPIKIPSLLKYLAGILGILFFGAVFITMILKLARNKPAIIVDDKGLTDNASGVSAGLIEWSDILGIEITSVTNQLFISIYVRDPEKYMQNTGLFKKWMMKMNQSIQGTNINIPKTTLGDDFDELYKLLVLELQLRNGDKIA